jgi:hypothetical protein
MVAGGTEGRTSPRGPGCQQPASALAGLPVAGFAGQRISRRPDRAHHRHDCANKAGQGRWFKTPIRVSDAASTIKYEAEKPQALLDEDKVIGAMKLGIRPDAVQIIPAEDVFRR